MEGTVGPVPVEERFELAQRTHQMRVVPDQGAVPDRPPRLLALDPRKRGRSGNAAALAPAIVQCAVSSFEGFAEDFFATVLYRQGQSFAQIVKKMNLTNPAHTFATVDDTPTTVLVAMTPEIDALVRELHRVRVGVDR